MSEVVQCRECRHCDYVQIANQFGFFKACTNSHVIAAGGKPIGAAIDGRKCSFYSRGQPQKSARVVA